MKKSQHKRHPFFYLDIFMTIGIILVFTGIILWILKRGGEVELVVTAIGIVITIFMGYLGTRKVKGELGDCLLPLARLALLTHASAL